jgi:hypothetical protein
MRAISILPKANWLMAQSMTMCLPPLWGMLMINGLLPILGSMPPHAGVFGMVFVQQMPTQPLSAACQP